MKFDLSATGLRFSRHVPKEQSPFERLFEIFKELITHTSGDFDEAIDWLAQLGYDPQFGARPLKRILQKRVMDDLSKSILSGKVTPGQAIQVNFQNGELVFE